MMEFGWFSPALSLSIELDEGLIVPDTGEIYSQPPDSYAPTCTAHEIGCQISGRIKLTTQNNSKIWHSGIKVGIHQYLHLLDPFISTDICQREIVIASEGYVQGSYEYYFSVPLDCKYKSGMQAEGYCMSSKEEQSQANGLSMQTRQTCVIKDIRSERLSSVTSDNSSGMPSGSETAATSSQCCKKCCYWHSTYDGSYYGLRHNVVVTVMRPWYCNENILSKAIRLYKLGSNSVGDTAFRRGRVNTVMSLPDCGGSCTGSILGGRYIDMSSRNIHCAVSFKNLRQCIISTHVLLICAEYVEETSSDTVVGVHRVFGPESPEVYEELSKQALRTSGFLTRSGDIDDEVRPDDPIMKSGTITFDFPFDKFIGTLVVPPISANEACNSLWAGLTQTLQSRETPFEICPSFDTAEEGMRFYRGEDNSCDVPVRLTMSSAINASVSGQSVDLSEVSLSLDEEEEEVQPVERDDNNDVLEHYQDSIALRYYLRFVVEDVDKKAYWNTTEIRFFRSQAPAPAPRNASASAVAQHGDAGAAGVTVAGPPVVHSVERIVSAAAPISTSTSSLGINP